MSEGTTPSVSGSSTPPAVTNNTDGGSFRPNTASTALAPRVNNARSESGANDPDTAPGEEQRLGSSAQGQSASRATPKQPSLGSRAPAAHALPIQLGATSAQQRDPQSARTPTRETSPHGRTRSTTRRAVVIVRPRPTASYAIATPGRHPSGRRPAVRTACKTPTRHHHQHYKAAAEPSRQRFQHKKRHDRGSAHCRESLLTGTVAPGHRIRGEGHGSVFGSREAG